MKHKRSQSRPGATHTNAKSLLLLPMLLALALALSGCYMDPGDRVLDNNDGLTVGEGGQQYETVITPTPVVTATPTAAPTDAAPVNWDDWTFNSNAGSTTPPPNLTPSGGQTLDPNAGAQGASPTPTPTSAGTASTGTLRSGSTGSEVSQLQTRLKELGYYSGVVDGQYGGATINAVKAFQTANNLSADGVAGPATQTAIYSYAPVRASGSTNSSSTNSSSNATATPRPTTRPTTATATSTPSYSGRTDIYLRLGDSGSQVKIMQNRLIVLGYLSGTADGNFQQTTEAAVIAFQKRNSLGSDGVAGPSTLSKLYSSSAKKASSVVANLGPLKRGMNGNAVRSLQEQLKKLGYYSGSIDGDYGSGTEAAVIAFQSANGLTADGIAGTATQNAIFAGSGTGSTTGGGSSSSSPQTYGASASSNGYTTITASSSSASITSLQSVLQSRNYYSGALDGSYGSGTTSAVSNYQKAAGLRVTGMAGPSTLRLLYGGTPESGSYQKLEKGSSGSAVRTLQYALYELMYYDGSITGQYDDATRNAVLLFQQVNGLTVDGVAGEATQRRLYSSNAIPCNI